MKNFTVPGLCLALFLFNTSLKAQVTSLVGPENVNSVSHEIVNTFGSILGVSNTQINHFLSNMLSGVSEHSSCMAPQASVFHTTAQGITFIWPAANGGQAYKIGYLNLKNGNLGSHTYNPNPYNRYQYNNIPDDLYLFAFQTLCPGGNSKLNIIIQDKDILFVENAVIGCNCATPGNYIPFENNTNGFESFEISVQDEGYSVLKIRGEKEGATTFLNYTCPGDFGYTYENGIAYYGLGEMVITVSLDMELSGDYEVFIRDCNASYPWGDGSTRLVRNNDTPNHVFPNPFSNSFQLEYALNQNEMTTIKLLNARGQQVLQPIARQEDAGPHQASFNTESLPNGLYYCVLQTGQQIQRFSLVKQE